MPGVARKDKDSAGGLIKEGSPDVFANGFAVARIGDAVTPHAPLNSPHIASPVMAQGSPNVFANGIAVSRAGDLATCGHEATGSADVLAN